MVVAPYLDAFTPAAAGCSKKRRWFQHLQDPVPAKKLFGSSTVRRLLHPLAVANCSKNGRWFQLQRTPLPAYCVAGCSFPLSEVLALPVQAHRLNGSSTTTVVRDATLTDGNQKIAMAASAFGCGDHGEERSKLAMAFARNCRKVACSGQGASRASFLCPSSSYFAAGKKEGDGQRRRWKGEKKH
uniref:Uncharacterized protein n=1 Tax=Aegilops tauschii subsp. strangulata TaxID=200361 RepID=A0A453GJN3_AEGTS